MSKVSLTSHFGSLLMFVISTLIYISQPIGLADYAASVRISGTGIASKIFIPYTKIKKQHNIVKICPIIDGFEYPSLKIDWFSRTPRTRANVAPVMEACRTHTCKIDTVAMVEIVM